MAIRDILTKNYGTGSSNELSKLIQDKSFNYNVSRYPLDLGTEGSGKSHYIIFHILQQRESQYKTQNVPLDQGGTINYEYEKLQQEIDSGGVLINRTAGAVGKGFIDFLGIKTSQASTPTQLSDNKVVQSIPGYGVTNNIVQGATGAIRAGTRELQKTFEAAGDATFLRTVTKTKESIALYMPDTLNFVQPQGYTDLETGNSLVTALFAGGQSLVDVIKKYSGGDMNGLGAQVAENLSPFLQDAAGKAFGNFTRATVAAGLGVVTNPMIEVLYTSPSLRNFRFDFVFYPQNQLEALAVQKIINSFQFHQAPEIAKNGTNGYFLVPPSEFDIEFYYAGKENVNLPAISTCVLTSVDIDYAPNGFTAYQSSNPNPEMGGTGMPVAIKMSLDFKETSIVTKASRQFGQPVFTQQ